MRVSYKIWALMLALPTVCCALAQQTKEVFAQADRSYLLDNAWIQSRNPAGLISLNLERTAAAEMSGDISDGLLRSYSDPETSKTFAAKTDAFLRLGAEKSSTVIRGSVSYERKRNENQCGSVFLQEKNKPFDLIPLDTMAGRKRLEQYNLVGAIARPIGAWTIGASFDFTAANYAKLRDLRHTNQLLDLEASVGALRQIGTVSVGANYTYRRRVEGVKFGVYGVQDREYKVLVSSGMYWGVAEEASSSLGYAQTSHSLPLYDCLHGAAVQIGTDVGKFSLYAQPSASVSSGHFGLRSATTAVFAQHNKREMAVDVQATLRGEKVLHRLDVNFGCDRMQNFEKIYRVETDKSKQQMVKYYGTLQTMAAASSSQMVAYRVYFGADSLVSRWAFELIFLHEKSNQKAMQNVEIKSCELAQNKIVLSASRNMVLQRNMLIVNLQSAVRFGKGEPCKTRYLDATNAVSSKLLQLETPLQRDFAFAAATVFSAQAEIEYRRSLRNVALGVKVRYGQEQTEAQPWLEGTSRNAYGIAITCQY